MTAPHDVTGTLHRSGDLGVVRITGRFANDPEDVWAAITDPARLAQWYGTVGGDLRVWGLITALATVSQSDFNGRVDVCDRPTSLRITTWNEEGREHLIAADLTPEGSGTTLVVDTRGMPVDITWAYGAGWHVHVEDLAAHLTGTGPTNWPASSNARWEELERTYQSMTVEALES